MDITRWVYRVAILASVLGAVVWYLDESIPDGFTEDRKIRLMFAGLKIVTAVSKALDVCGIYPYHQSLRYVSELNTRSVPTPEGLLITDHNFDGIPVRVYKPVAKNPVGYPAVVFYHGGGFVFGSITSYNHLMVQLGKDLDLVIVSVGYRLTPDVKFPVPFTDCEFATKYFLEHAPEFDVDAKRVAIMGESAGGNLAAAVTLKLRNDNFSPLPKRQILIYPTLQSVDMSLPSYQQNGQGPGLKLELSAYFRSLYAVGSSKYSEAFARNEHTSPEAKVEIYKKYIRHEDLQMDYHYKPYRKPKLDFGNATIWDEVKDVVTNPYCSPLLNEDFAGLPDACVVTLHYDMLRDEGILYAQKLREAGVKVNHIHVTHAYHGVWTLSSILEEGQRLFDRIVVDIKQNL